MAAALHGTDRHDGLRYFGHRTSSTPRPLRLGRNPHREIPDQVRDDVTFMLWHCQLLLWV